MPEEKTPDQEQARLEYQLKRMEGLSRALPSLYASKQRAISADMREGGSNWRAAVDAVKGWNTARASGDRASLRKMITDIIDMPVDRAPADQEYLRRLNDALQVDPRTMGLANQDSKRRQVAWERFMADHPNANADPTMLGTYNAMSSAYGDFDPTYLQSSDQSAVRNSQEVLKQVELQRNAVRWAEGNRARILAEVPDPNNIQETDLDRIITNVPLAGDTAAMTALDAMAAKAPQYEMSAATKELVGGIDRSIAAAETAIAAPVDAPAGETPRDKMARIVADPDFRWWAEQHGFKIGTVTPDAGQNASPDAKTVVGYYTQGPDDMQAVRLMLSQTKKDPEKPGTPGHGIFHRALGGGQRTYGYVRVTDNEAGNGNVPQIVNQAGDVVDNPAEQFPNSTQWVKLKDGKWAPLPDKASESYTNWLKENMAPLEEQPAERPIGVEGAIQAGVLKESTTPGKTRLVYGEFLAPDTDQPTGSLKVRTSQGDRVYTGDQIVDSPTVRVGGGEKQTVARLYDLVAGKLAENKAERGEGTNHWADAAAIDLVPEYYSAREQGAVAERDREQQVVETKKERGAAQISEVRGETPRQAEATRADIVTPPKKEDIQERDTMADTLTGVQVKEADRQRQLDLVRAQRKAAMSGDIGIRVTRPGATVTTPPGLPKYAGMPKKKLPSKL